MKKRNITLFAFSALLLGGLSACGNGGKAQIGILQFGGFDALEKAKNGFLDVIKESKFKDKIDINVQNANAVGADNSTMAATLSANSDLLYGIATPSTAALKNAVDSLGVKTPVIFSAVTNPEGAKLLKEPSAPEGNCTGVVDIGPIEEELRILTMFPDVDNIVSLYTSSEVNSIFQVEIAEEWMKDKGVAFSRKGIADASQLSAAISSIGSEVDAVFLPTDDTIANAINVVKTANEARTDKLLIVGSDTGMIDGCTFALGVDYYQCGKQAAEMAIKVLDGTPIKNIPVERCDKKDVVINKKEADVLGIIIPEEVLAIEGAKIIE